MFEEFSHQYQYAHFSSLSMFYHIKLVIRIVTANDLVTTDNTELIRPTTYEKECLLSLSCQYPCHHYILCSLNDLTYCL